MPFSATVLPVMVASPGDVQEYRGHARTVIHEWNYIHSASTGLVLMPVGWETHSSPELGSSPQELINDRVLEDCDLLVGIFWTRLGTPTDRAPSGTVEEIQRHVRAGKPAMVYFSRQPAALDTVDAGQYAALKQFRAWCESQGLIETFFSSNEFQEKLRRQIQIAIQKNRYLAGIVQNAVKVHEGSQSTASADDSTAGLSPEAKELLRSAAGDKGGIILATNTLSGRIVSANNRTFGTPDDRRTMAKWDFALEQLLTLGFIESLRGPRTSASVFQLTELGYRAAEAMQPE